MGDRANVAILQHDTRPPTAEGYDPPAIFVYLHWGGYNLPKAVQAALVAARPRWHDEPYGTRILIDQLTKDGRDQEDSFGVSLLIGDNEYPVIVVDLANQRVRIISEGAASAGIFTTSVAITEFTFAEYLALHFNDDDDRWSVVNQKPVSSPAN